ncbi:MAG: hypothetical protein ABMA25_20650 [Ilumatobacteraceae bacterium]
MSDFIARVKVRSEAVAKRAEARFVAARERGGPVDLGAQLYERDRDSHASVLGSAIALRLFLFVIPATVALVGLVNVFRLGAFLQDDLEASTTTGSISKALNALSWSQALWILLSGSVLTLFAGRSLSRVLAASSGGAWNMTVRESKVPPLAILALTGVLFAEIASSTIFQGLRDVPGFTAALTAWLAAVASTALTWFVVMLMLPRKVRDPGALLPGAALMGVAYTVLQWFMQFYLPKRVERTTDTFGDLAVTVATLGNFFFIGRIMASSFVVTAVVYERWGSLSQLLFDLPGLRTIARRSPKLRRFFSLDLDHTQVAETDVGAEEFADDSAVGEAGAEPSTADPA